MRLSGPRKFFVFLFAGSLLAVPAPASAATWQLPFIDVNALSVNQGSPVSVTFGVLINSTCKVWLQSDLQKSKAVSYKVSSRQKNASLSTKGLKVGKYTVRVNCGKGGSGKSDPVFIVAKGVTTLATCAVTSKGFAITPKSGASYGIELKNTSPVLTAVTVVARVTFQDAAGVTVASARLLPMDIAPGETAFAGGAEFAPGIASMQVETSCDSSLDAPNARIRGVAVATPLAGSIFESRITGAVVNARTFTIAEYSPVAYLVRDANGAVIGGGVSYLGLLLLPGGTAAWKADSYLEATKIKTITWVLDPFNA